MRFEVFWGFKWDFKFLVKIFYVLTEVSNQKLPVKPTYNPSEYQA